MVHLIWNCNPVCFLDFNKRAKIHKLYSIKMFIVSTHLDDDVFSSKITIHGSRVGYVFQEDANLQDELSKLLGSIRLLKNLVKSGMLHLIVLDNFLRVEADFPE